MNVVALFLLALLPFTIATAPYRFSFPRDHGAHFGYQSEWWYFTGHLRSANGRRFGIELTIFRFGLRPGLMKVPAGESKWHGSEVYPAHFAITDEHDRTFFHDERFERSALGMGFAEKGALDVRSGDWSIRGSDPIVLQARDRTGRNALELTLRAEKPPAINGRGGISRKGPCRSCASHYYSMTRLQTVGTLRAGGTSFAVRGLSWMDHEYGSDQLQSTQSGWDWFSLQLDDDRELMLYRLRQKDGSTTPQSSGSLVMADGRVRHLTLAQFRTTPLATWKSPHTGAVYPSGWRVLVPSEGIDVTVTPVLRDQELLDPQIGVAYWEGDCDVRGTDRSSPVRGVAYVELTGYAGALHL